MGHEGGHGHGKHSHEGHAHEHEHPAHEHGHDHPAHEHDHDHPHDHDHTPALAREDLKAHAGHGKILFFDAPSGLAGDMIIAALVDLGVPPSVIVEAVEGLGVGGFHLHFGTRTRSGVVATAFDVHVDGPQPERTYREIRHILDHAKLDAAVRERAHATFATLARAEAKVHRSSLDDVHFHEVGAIDALVDVVGSAAALEWIGAEVVVSPLPMGRGFVKARHGVLPLPAPATVEALAGLPTYDGGLDFEFVTPTGAAIVGAQASRAARWPAMAPERVGWGAGQATLADRPNLLRAVLGTKEAPLGDRPSSPPASHAVLEANLDDATGELLASCIQSLLDAGAVDAWATPIVMKKGRPAVTLSALVPLAHVDAATLALLRESTTIGLRRHDVSRVERPRRSIMVTTRFGALPVKVAEGPWGPPQLKPEFDACAAAARSHGAPVREVLRAALEAASLAVQGAASPRMTTSS